MHSCARKPARARRSTGRPPSTRSPHSSIGKRLVGFMRARLYLAYFAFDELSARSRMKALLDRVLAKGRALVGLPSAYEKAQQAAAARLRAAGRVPINIWGDAMLDGSDPVVRRVVTGKDGHESLLSFFYMNEIFTLNEMVRAIPAKQATPDRPASVSGRYAALKQATPDPQHHASSELLQVFLPSTLFFKAVGQENTELCELGCTFFSAVDKMMICSSLLDAGLDFRRIKCAAVDHSDFFLRGAATMHPGDNIVSYLDYQDWRPSTPH